LSRHFRVLRYDIRGHGRSPVIPRPSSIDDLADDVVALLDRLGLHQVHFVGLSIGGMTGMRLAAREPGRVDRLVVLCTAPRLEPTQAWLDRAALVRAEGAAIVAATPAEGYASCCEAIAGMDLRDDLSSVFAPTLAIAGAQDPATPPPHLELIASSVKDGSLLVVEQSAHLANDEQPERINAAPVAHLRGGSS